MTKIIALFLCLEIPFEQFREAAREIMEGKKDQVIAIRDAVISGDITREEAHEQLKALNEAVREEVENCEACLEAKEAICECNDNLFDKIITELGLTEDQLQLWNEWLTEHPSPCAEG